MRRPRRSPILLIAMLTLTFAFLPTASGEPGSVRVDILDGTEVLRVNGEIRYAIVEGDILIPWDEWTAGHKTLFKPDLWIGGLIRYEFDDLTLPQEDMVLEAFAIIEGITNVTFSEGIAFLEEGVRISSTNPADCGSCECKNAATVGSSVAGTVKICDWILGIVLHELGHTLGLRHEQSRPDRDTYLQIHYENILDHKEGNYDIRDEEFYGPYDFLSLMHYSPYAFIDPDICPPPNVPTCRTITVLPPFEAYQDSIGRVTEFSELDRLGLSLMYLEPDWKVVDTDFLGVAPNGTLLRPYRSIQQGASNIPPWGTLWIQPGFYSLQTVYSQPMIWRAPLGGVTISP